MTKGKWLVFAGLSVILSTGLLLAGVFVLDLFLHKRFSRAAGLNTRGYRGSVEGHKAPGERRVVVLGGSTAFGYGVSAEDAFPAHLERVLKPVWESATGQRINVINLAYNNQGAYSFKPTLEDYENLQYDVAVLYEGYNDLGGAPNRAAFRRDSPIFRLTGYYPIFPTVFKEKAMLLRHGNLSSAYNGDKTVFRPNAARRATASALDIAVRASDSLDRQLERFSTGSAGTQSPAGLAECGNFAFYCQSMADAVDYVLSKDRAVIIVSQPYMSDGHGQQQDALVGMLSRRYAADPRVRYVDLRDGVVDLKRPELCYDGMHLTAEGNALVAKQLLMPVLELVSEPRAGRTVASAADRRQGS